MKPTGNQHETQVNPKGNLNEIKRNKNKTGKKTKKATKRNRTEHHKGSQKENKKETNKTSK